ncbi:MAG: hypothetical protein AAF696_25635, partial [Bacteroidota bacterium]
MKYVSLFFLFLGLSLGVSFAQDTPLLMVEELPYKEIGPAPEVYTAATMAARMIDGLGYRYYWATEGLRKEDMDYLPSKDARTLKETLTHIHGLSQAIFNASRKLPNEGPSMNRPDEFKALRQATLKNLEQASIILKKNPNQDMEELKVIFKRGENSSEFPYWNLINGQISDAL